MSIATRRVSRSFTVAAVIATLSGAASSQEREKPAPKPTTLPNPYRLDPDWPTLPATMKGPNGRKWGEVIRVHAAPDGNIWVFHRCFNTVPPGSAVCINRGAANPPILQFDPSGKLLKSFDDKPNGDATCLNRGDANPPILEFTPAGQLRRSLGVGLFAHPHGFTVDKEGNLWTTDTNDEEAVLGIPARNANGIPIGQQVFKISPSGQVLMTLGKAGIGGSGSDALDRPTGVAVADNGDIFVSDGHARNKSNNARVVKFSRTGTFIKAWGRLGSEPGNFREPHDIYVGGSRGYVYVADRLNNRVQVFDQEGAFIAAWTQFGQPSSVYVDKSDNIYVGATFLDASRPGSVMKPGGGPNNRAIVVGHAITGELK
jgi:DNA-binding beta-propeller fold protein YncE